MAGDGWQILREMRARVDGMVTRAVVRLVNDSLKMQKLQLTLLADMPPVDNVEHAQPYGLSFVPPVGSQAIALAVGGARSYTIAICADHPGERPTGAKPREGGLYSAGQWRVFVDEDGTVCVGDKTSGQKIPLGDALVAAFNAHTHTAPSGGGATTPPIEPLVAADVLSRHKIAP